MIVLVIMSMTMILTSLVETKPNEPINHNAEQLHVAGAKRGKMGISFWLKK